MGVRRGGAPQILGAKGTIVGADGRHSLMHVGFELLRPEDVLAERVLLFGDPAVQGAESFAIGKTATHLVVQAGPWIVWLPIDIEDRYPAVERILPNPANLKTC